ncbi:hypothetical protein [Nonomuraea sp. NEAU-A123]|nr:hypothetical protein [Nonomuraea sp. NEAU-A123]MBT2229271.1 hypothetical protein [Nonomuraea sp. NEAU-A123]
MKYAVSIHHSSVPEMSACRGARDVHKIRIAALVGDDGLAEDDDES